MKNNLIFVLFVVLSLSLLGCGPGKKAEEATQAGKVSVGTDVNDPRWRQKILETSLESIARVAESRDPRDVKQSYEMALERLDDWLQNERAPRDWTVDPFCGPYVEPLDTLDPVRTALDGVVNTFGPEFSEIFQCVQQNDAQKMEAGYPKALTEPQRAAIGKLVEVLKPAEESFATSPLTADGPAQYGTFVALHAMLREDLRVFSALLDSGWVKFEFMQYLQQRNVFMQRIGILSGSGRLHFDSGRCSDRLGVLNLALLQDTYLFFERELLQSAAAWAQGEVDVSAREQDLSADATNPASVSDVAGLPNRVTVSSNALERATCLFAWVMSQTFCPVEPPDTRPAALPTEVLLTGSATPEERMWLAILLGRQVHLDFFVLQVPVSWEENSESKSGARLLLAFRDAEEIYLFDPILEIPVSKNVTRTPTGLRFEPVSWSEVTKDVEILNDLWRRAGLKETVNTEQILKTVAFVEMAPWHDTLRVQMLTQKFSKITPLVEEVRRLGGETLADVRYWTFPLDVVVSRALAGNLQEVETFRNAPFAQSFARGNDDAGVHSLWRARLLTLKGILTGPLSATLYYQQARISDAQMQELVAEINRNLEEGEKPLMSPEQAEAVLANLRQWRLYASYFMGDLMFAVRNNPAALEYYDSHVIQSPLSPCVWSEAAKLKCGLLCEFGNQPEKAVQWYDSIQGVYELPAAKVRRSFLAD